MRTSMGIVGMWAALLAGLLFSSLPALGQSQISSPVDNARRVTLAGNVHPLAQPAYDQGQVPADFPAQRMVLVLKRSAARQAALQQLLQSLHNPASPEYHQYLTPQQFGARFGVADGDLATLSAWLQAQGFIVARTLSGHLGIEFSGSAAQVQAAFHTSIHSYVINGEQHYANAQNPQIPAALASVVTGITLNNFAPRPMHTAAGHAALDPATHRAKPLFNDPVTNQNDCLDGYCFGVAPGDFAAIYDTKPLLASGVTGAGVTVGIVGVAPIDTAIVKRFRQNFLPAYSADNLPVQIVDGPVPTEFGSDDQIEAYLDVEEAGAMAPNATIDFYTAGNSYTTNGLGLALARALEDNQVSVLSVSFGACEAYLGTTYNAFYSDLFEQAVAQGITVLVSSGDTGSAACDPPYNTSGPQLAISGLFVNGLASSPYSVAVGGTDFYYPANATLSTLGQYWTTPTATDPNNNADWSSAKGYIPEKPWNLSDPVLDQVNLSPALQAAGGGKSNCIVYTGTLIPGQGPDPADCKAGYPQPDWQKGFTQDTVRDLPDVSLFASDGSNYSFTVICASAGDCKTPNAGPDSTNAPLQVTEVGGTSVAAPVMAGIMALVVDKTGSRQGQANTVLYPLSQQVPQAFHDVTAGTIAVGCVAGTYNCGADGFLTGYSAAPGYDLASGLGSLDVAELVNHWTQVTFKPTATTLSITPATAKHGTALTFTVNVTGGAGSPAAGDIALLITRGTGAPQGQYQTTCAAFPCTFSYAALPGGKYRVSAHYAGSSVYAASTSPGVAVDISAEPSQLGVYYQIGDTYVDGAFTQVMNLNGQTLIYGGIVGFTAVPAPADLTLPSDPTQLKSTPGTGTIQVSDNGQPIGPPLVLDSTGRTTFSSTALAVGKHSLTAAYTGDASYAPSSTLAPVATPMAFTIGKTETAINLQPFYQQILPGKGATVTAYLNVEGAQPPTGTVTFFVNNANGVTTQLTAPLKYVAATYLAQAVAQIPASALAAGPPTVSENGNNTVTASYSGDGNYEPLPQQGNAAIYDAQVYTNILLYATPQAPVAGQSTALTARVGWTNLENLSGYPAGSVTFLDTFRDGNTTLGTTATVADPYGNGVATFTTSKLAVGTHTITANYTGNAQFGNSTATFTLTVAPAPPPVLDFTVKATPISLPGGETSPSASSTLSFQLNYAPTDATTLTLDCAPPPQSRQITCAVPASLTIAAGAVAGTSTLTVSLEGRTAQLHAAPISAPGTGGTGGQLLAAGAGLAAASMLPLWLLLRRRRWSGMGAGLILLAAAGTLIAGLSGCQFLHYNTVPAGAYDVTVTVHLASTPGSIAHQVTVPVQVQ